MSSVTAAAFRKKKIKTTHFQWGRLGTIRYFYIGLGRPIRMEISGPLNEFMFEINCDILIVKLIQFLWENLRF